MTNKEEITLKCPYNDFKDCFEFQCPFYYKQWQIIDHATGKRGLVSHCKRAEKEIRRRNQ